MSSLGVDLAARRAVDSKCRMSVEVTHLSSLPSAEGLGHGHRAPGDGAGPPVDKLAAGGADLAELRKLLAIEGGLASRTARTLEVQQLRSAQVRQRAGSAAIRGGKGLFSWV